MNSSQTPELHEGDNPSGMEYRGRHTTSVIRQETDMTDMRLNRKYLLGFEEVFCISEQHLLDARVKDDR